MVKKVIENYRIGTNLVNIIELLDVIHQCLGWNQLKENEEVHTNDCM